MMLCLAGTAHAFDPDMIQIHGFVSQGYLKSSEYDFWRAETEDGTFQFKDEKTETLKSLKKKNGALIAMKDSDNNEFEAY